MAEKRIINKIYKLLPTDPNKLYHLFCQENFFRSLPLDVLNRLVTTVIVDSRSSASSLHSYINMKGIQDRNIRIIYELNYSHLNPHFDLVIVEKNTLHISDFISWLKNARCYTPHKIIVFINSSVNENHTLDSPWQSLTNNWMYTEITMNVNATIPIPAKGSKFVDEELEVDNYG